MRWRRVVLRSDLGEPHEPDDVHGCCLTPVNKSDYLSKLGLEMADVFTKKGREKSSRTPLQIACDILRYRGREADVTLWKSYCAATKGARFLNFSKEIQALREELGLLAEDEDLASREELEGEAEPEIVASITPSQWRDICRVRGAREHLLTVAEKLGGYRVGVEVDVLVASVEEARLAGLAAASARSLSPAPVEVPSARSASLELLAGTRCPSGLSVSGLGHDDGVGGSSTPKGDVNVVDLRTLEGTRDDACFHRLPCGP